MASIVDENDKQIRNNVDLSIVIIGEDATPFECTWNPETKRLTWTAADLPHSFLTIQVNEQTEYVVTNRKRWYPNPSGYIFLPEHSSQIAFRGEGAAPAELVGTQTMAVSGFHVQLDNRSITSCNLALRSTLDYVNASWETSEINLSFILPTATPETLQFIATTIQGAYISYGASFGEAQDYTDSLRRFTCTTEGIDYTGKEITLTGVDQSEKLSKNQAPRYFTFTTLYGFERLYALFRSFLTNAGIENLTVEDAPPPATTGSDTTDSVFLTERTYSSYVLFFMRHMAVETNLGALAFWPRYVDAGRPSATWRYPEVKWVIKEEECGDIQWRYEPEVKSFSMSNEAADSIGMSRENIETKQVKAGRKYWFDLQDPYRALQCTNATIEYSNPLRVKIKATATGDATLSGIPIEIYDNGIGQDTFTFGQYGQALTEDGEWYFEGATADAANGDVVEFAARADIFTHSETQFVTFTWKGDPRMQPLDLFIFEHEDSSEVWTIGSITLDHTGGGMTAEITARRGVL